MSAAKRQEQDANFRRALFSATFSDLMGPSSYIRFFTCEFIRRFTTTDLMSLCNAKSLLSIFYVQTRFGVACRPTRCNMLTTMSLNEARSLIFSNILPKLTPWHGLRQSWSLVAPAMMICRPTKSDGLDHVEVSRLDLLQARLSSSVSWYNVSKKVRETILINADSDISYVNLRHRDVWHECTLEIWKVSFTVQIKLNDKFVCC